jgi:signal transduction histidine kinase
MDTGLFIIVGAAGVLLISGIVMLLLVTHQRKVWQEQHKLQTFQLEQQKELMRAIIATQEEERERIAQDLHDDIGALAISLKVNNDAISDYLDHPEKLKEIQHKNESLANDIIKTGRTVSHDLLPPIIKKCGLIEALNILAENLNVPGKTNISFSCNQEEVELDNLAEISLYRVMNEWIHNVLKHAEATNLSIRAEVNHSDLTITTTDNGKGFDFEKVKKKSTGLGLMNIEGRLNQLNAYFQFHPNATKGTIFTIQYQLNPS